MVLCSFQGGGPSLRLCFEGRGCPFVLSTVKGRVPLLFKGTGGVWAFLRVLKGGAPPFVVGVKGAGPSPFDLSRERAVPFFLVKSRSCLCSSHCKRQGPSLCSMREREGAATSFAVEEERGGTVPLFFQGGKGARRLSFKRSGPALCCFVSNVKGKGKGSALCFVRERQGPALSFVL